MAEFFTRRTAPGDYGLALFLNAGDPSLAVLADLLPMLDERGVDCLELAVPFPDSVTDGPTIRRSARRALDGGGVTLDDVLAFVARVRPTLRTLRIALLADWAYSIRGRALRPVLGDIAQSGADGVLLHALPPRLRQDHYAAASDAGLRVVTTCYHGVSNQQVIEDAAMNATAYLYLVAHYGRSGTAVPAAGPDLAAGIAAVRTRTRAPVAVGFGVRDRAAAEAVARCGADAVIVGSAGVERVEESLTAGRDVVSDFEKFVLSMKSSAQESTA